MNPGTVCFVNGTEVRPDVVERKEFSNIPWAIYVLVLNGQV